MIRKLLCDFIILYIFLSIAPITMAENMGFTQTFVYKKSDIEKVETLISQYGKPAFITLIRSYNNGKITIQVNSRLQNFSGYPTKRYITPYSILSDLSELGWTFKKAEELILAQINKKIKEEKIEKDRIRKIETLISKYGKSNIIISIQFLKGGHCTMQVGNELRKSLGRPQEKFVTPYSILFDFNELELTIEKAEESILHVIEQKKQTVARQIEKKRMARKIVEQEQRDYEEFLSGKGKYDKKRIKQPNNNSQWKFGLIILIFCLLFVAWVRWVSGGNKQTFKNDHGELRAEEFNSEAGADAKSEIKDISSFLNMGTNAKPELQNQIKKDFKKQKSDEHGAQKFIWLIIYSAIMVVLSAQGGGVFSFAYGIGRSIPLLVFGMFLSPIWWLIAKKTKKSPWLWFDWLNAGSYIMVGLTVLNFVVVSYLSSKGIG